MRYERPGAVVSGRCVCRWAGMLVAPLVFWAPCGVLAGWAAMCARGRRPAREPSALRASLGVSTRCPARPRHHPRAPRQVPPVPSTPVGPGVLACGSVRCLVVRPGPATTHGHRSQALRSLPRQWGLVCWRVVRCVASLSGQVPPLVGTAARQRRGLSLWPRRSCMKERSPLRSTGRSFGVPL